MRNFSKLQVLFKLMYVQHEYEFSFPSNDQIIKIYTQTFDEK